VFRVNGGHGDTTHLGSGFGSRDIKRCRVLGFGCFRVSHFGCRVIKAHLVADFGCIVIKCRVQGCRLPGAGGRLSDVGCRM
jgi:hypothetical protein